jgi:hypothetical protein
MNGGDGEANNYSSGAPVSSGAIEQWREEIEEERERMRRERGLPRRGNSEPPRPVPLEVVYEFAHEAARAAEAAIDAAAASARAARRAAVAAELVADAMARGGDGNPGAPRRAGAGEGAQAGAAPPAAGELEPQRTAVK